MLIQGSLATYNFVACSNTYLMLDIMDGHAEIYSRAGIAYIAFVSRDVLPLPAEQSSSAKRQATIIFQLNLKTVMFYGKQANRFENIPITHTAYREAVEARVAAIISRITDLTRAHDQEHKYLVFGDPEVQEGYELGIDTENNIRFRRPYTLRVEDMTILFDGTVTLADEYYGPPKNLDKLWTPMYGSAFDVLTGCSVNEAIEAKTGIPRGVVGSVLNALKDVIAGTSVQAVRFGAYSLDYFVPPLGIFKIRPNFNPAQLPLDIGYEPDRRIKMEMASALGFDFNEYNNMTVASTVADYRQKGKNYGINKKIGDQRRS